MSVERADFLARFPEFEPASKAMVESAIAEAVRNVDAEIFGDKTDEAIRLKVAHNLAVSIFGQQARKTNKEDSTTYEKEFWKLARSVTPGFRVA